MNFEETKTVKSYFSCSLSSLLGFWVVLEPFRFLFRSSCSPSAIPQSTQAIGTLQSGSIMSQLWPIGDDVSQFRSLTNYARVQYNPSWCQSNFVQRRSVCSALIKVSSLFGTEGHRFAPPSPLSDFLLSVFSLYLLRITYMYFQFNIRSLRFKIG